MNRISKKFIAILTMSVIALTVMVPEFVWEAKASDEYAVSEMNVPCPTDAHDAHQPGADHHDNHPCGCHMFSHLPIQASASNTPRFPKLPEAFGFQIESIHSSPAPDSIDQPPKPSLA